MRAYALLLSLLVVATALAGCAQNDANNGIPSTLKVGTDAAYAPFEDTVNGQIVGFDVDVLTEIGNRSGFKVEFQNSEFKSIIPSIQSGQFHAGMSAFTITDERKQQVDFSAPYYDNKLMAAVLATNNDVTKEDDIKPPRRVCTQVGTTSEAYLKEELGHGNDTLQLLDTAPPCADALKRGDVDAILIDYAFIRNLVAKSGGELKEAFTIDPGEQFGIAVKKGNTELLNAINKALAAMKSDGTLKKLADKWQV